jgi:hypothetical protein
MVEDILDTIDPNGKNILYPSSCLSYKEFQELPYDSVILNSRLFSRKKRIGKVYCLDYDNNELLGILHSRGINLSAMVIIRDGCVEGGNYECIAREGFISRTMPVMSTQFDLFSDHGIFPLDIPANFIECDTPGYLGPFIIKSNPLGKLRSFHIITYSIVEKDIVLGRIRLRVIWDSIWRYFDQSDLLVVRTKGSTRYSNPNYLLGRMPGVNPKDKFEFVDVCRMKSIKHILKKAEVRKLSRIAFMPTADGSYKRIINEIRAWEGDFPKEISFFHLNVNDYQYIVSYQTN